MPTKPSITKNSTKKKSKSPVKQRGVVPARKLNVMLAGGGGMGSPNPLEVPATTKTLASSNASGLYFLWDGCLARVCYIRARVVAAQLFFFETRAIN